MLRNDSHVVNEIQLLEIQKLRFKFVGNLGKSWGLVHSIRKCLPSSVANYVLKQFSLLSFQSLVRAEKLKDVKETCLAIWEFLVNYTVLNSCSSEFVLCEIPQNKASIRNLKKRNVFPPCQPYNLISVLFGIYLAILCHFCLEALELGLYSAVCFPVLSKECISSLTLSRGECTKMASSGRTRIPLLKPLAVSCSHEAYHATLRKFPSYHGLHRK